MIRARVKGISREYGRGWGDASLPDIKLELDVLEMGDDLRAGSEVVLHRGDCEVAAARGAAYQTVVRKLESANEQINRLTRQLPPDDPVVGIAMNATTGEPQSEVDVRIMGDGDGNFMSRRYPAVGPIQAGMMVSMNRSGLVYQTSTPVGAERVTSRELVKRIQDLEASNTRLAKALVSSENQLAQSIRIVRAQDREQRIGEVFLRHINTLYWKMVREGRMTESEAGARLQESINTIKKQLEDYAVAELKVGREVAVRVLGETLTTTATPSGDRPAPQPQPAARRIRGIDVE